MTAPRDRARQLLAKAVHPTTPVEEARTSAMAACQLIEKEHLLGASREAIAEAVREATETAYERGRAQGVREGVQLEQRRQRANAEAAARVSSTGAYAAPPRNVRTTQVYVNGVPHTVIRTDFASNEEVSPLEYMMRTAQAAAPKKPR